MSDIKCPNCKTGTLRVPTEEEWMIEHQAMSSYESARECLILLCDCGFCEWVTVGWNWTPYHIIAKVLSRLRET